jgi:hypothetical protein
MSATNSSKIELRWYVSVAAILFIFVVVAVYSMRMAENTTGYDQEQAQERYARLAALQEQDRKTTTTADWIDQAKGLVRIPVEEAMQQEVPVLAAKPVTMGAVIPGAVAPAGLPAPATPAASTNQAPAGNAPANPQPTK